MTADEMFTELGYKKIADDGKTMLYQKRFDDEPYAYELVKTITFYTRDNDISIEMYVEGEPLMATLTIPELQAINAKIKELGWEE